MITFQQTEPFQLFTIDHLTAVAVIISINLLIYVFRDKLRNSPWKKAIRIFLGVLLILQEISLNLFRLWNGTWSVATSLPLHLCGLAVISCAIMAFTKSKKIYNIVYFWGVGGATQALITPDIGVYGYPHFRFYQFFISHGLIITTLLFMTFVEKYRPSWQAMWQSIITLNLLMIPIGIINWITGGNYFFIAHPPETASLIDFLGPWPYYIIWLEVIGFVIFFLCYLPFVRLNKKDVSFSG